MHVTTNVIKILSRIFARWKGKEKRKVFRTTEQDSNLVLSFFFFSFFTRRDGHVNSKVSWSYDRRDNRFTTGGTAKPIDEHAYRTRIETNAMGREFRRSILQRDTESAQSHLYGNHRITRSSDQLATFDIHEGDSGSLFTRSIRRIHWPISPRRQAESATYLNIRWAGRARSSGRQM